MSAAGSRRIPPIGDLRALGDALDQAGIRYALGGSGLLHALGGDVDANDWDLTTDAPLGRAQAALADFEYDLVPATGAYRTVYLLRVRLPGSEADLIGDFAIETAEGLVEVPTLVTGSWHGVPLGDPVAWAAAYRAMGRPERATAFERVIERSLHFRP